MDSFEGTEREKDTLIVPADNGNSAVVMNVADYDKKALDVTGKKPFERVSKDPTRKVEDGINKLTYDCSKLERLKSRAETSAVFPLSSTPVSYRASDRVIEYFPHGQNV